MGDPIGVRILSWVGHILTWRLRRRLAGLTLEQRGFWSAAFADAIADAQEKGFSNSAEHHKAVEVATQKAWEKIYQR